MSYVSGISIIDAPASALNNAKAAKTGRTDNLTPVKAIRSAEGEYPYVSAQAYRYWLRTDLAELPEWKTTPTFRDKTIAYSAADPVSFYEDDLFGYMRAPEGAASVAEAEEAGLTPLEVRGGKVPTLVRISPLRTSTFVSVCPVRPTRDWGTMARVPEGDPVLHEHEFYRAHLKGGISLDLTAAGTFYVANRTGYRNLDEIRVGKMKNIKGAEQRNVRNVPAWRLPIADRVKRVTLVVEALGRVDGGAKQTLHLTDTAPSVLALCICKGGNQPFQRLFTADPSLERTVLRLDVLDEVLRTLGDDIQSDVYLGWSTGFLDEERARLENALKGEGEKPVAENWRGRIKVFHPREAASALAAELQKAERTSWFD